jgi:hypothetical protein
MEAANAGSHHGVGQQVGRRGRAPGIRGEAIRMSIRAQQNTGRGRTRQLWVEEPARRPRMADPVRAAAVRAVLLVSFTLIIAMVAVLGTLGRSWVAAPALLAALVAVVVSTWAVVDVWITRQVWMQRNGVVSVPSSAARAHRTGRHREGHEVTAADDAGRAEAGARPEEAPGKAAGHRDARRPGGHGRHGGGLTGTSRAA